MKDVYILIGIEYDEDVILGCFETRELAWLASTYQKQEFTKGFGVQRWTVASSIEDIEK